MNASTFIYLSLFATIVLLLYYILPKGKRVLLLVASYICVILTSKFLILFLIFTTISVYFTAKKLNILDSKYEDKKVLLEKEARKKLKNKIKRTKKIYIVCCVVINLLILAILKYINFFADILSGILLIFNFETGFKVVNIVLPLGISYYTLTAIGYLTDVYRKKYEATSLLNTALFIGYYPALIEGPFGFYDKLSPTLTASNKFDKKNLFYGIWLAIFGMFKILIVSNRLSMIVGPVFKNPQDFSGGIIIFATVAFTVQLYAEFSGMINVVTGISKMFGIELAKNFDKPFISQSVSEFWRRWHISLGNWFRDYVFYPITTSKGFFRLSKNMKGKVSKGVEQFIIIAFALLPVWFLTGLWHGASVKYIVYGLYYYVLMMIGTILKPLFIKLFKLDANNLPCWCKIFLIIKTMILVNFGMMIFRAENLSALFHMLSCIKNISGKNILQPKIISVLDFTVMCIGFVFMLSTFFIGEKRFVALGDKLLRKSLFTNLCIIAFAIIIIMIFGAYGRGYLPPDPIYGGF